MQWVIDAYTLCLAALLLSSGSLADRLGRRRMLLIGVATFTVSSVACACAPNAGTLIAARTIQGIGAAAVLPATLALISHLTPPGRLRERATSAWVGIGSLGAAVGPALGGVIIAVAGWRAIFLLNLPLGGVSYVLIRRHVPETPRGNSKIDLAGQAAATAVLTAAIAALILGGSIGWDTPAVSGLFAASVTFSIVFVFTQRRGRHAMIRAGIMAGLTRKVALLSALLMGLVFYGTLFGLSLYLQQVFRYSPLVAGVALLPLTGASLLAPFVFYRAAASRVGHSRMLSCGFLVAAAGAGLLAVSPTPKPYLVIVIGMLLIGAASTTAFSAFTSLTMNSARPNDVGLVSGLQNTLRQTGALIAVALIGAVLAAEPGRHVTNAFVILASFAMVGLTAAGVAEYRSAVVTRHVMSGDEPAQRRHDSLM